jgi:acetyltransferase
LLRQVIDYARAEGIGRIEGVILAENDKMLDMCRRFGFVLKRHPDGAGLVLATLSLG